MDLRSGDVRQGESDRTPLPDKRKKKKQTKEAFKETNNDR
jgi:hypothetical protein